MPFKNLSTPALCFLILFATLAAAGVGGMTVVSMRQKIAESSQRLQKSEAEIMRLERLGEELNAKIALMEHPEVLKKIASKFGMQPARLDQYRRARRRQGIAEEEDKKGAVHQQDV